MTRIKATLATKREFEAPSQSELDAGATWGVSVDYAGFEHYGYAANDKTRTEHCLSRVIDCSTRRHFSSPEKKGKDAERYGSPELKRTIVFLFGIDKERYYSGLTNYLENNNGLKQRLWDYEKHGDYGKGKVLCRGYPLPGPELTDLETFILSLVDSNRVDRKFLVQALQHTNAYTIQLFAKWGEHLGVYQNGLVHLHGQRWSGKWDNFLWFSPDEANPMVVYPENLLHLHNYPSVLWRVSQAKRAPARPPS